MEKTRLDWLVATDVDPTAITQHVPSCAECVGYNVHRSEGIGLDVIFFMNELA
jgi:hypothetical protein